MNSQEFEGRIHALLPDANPEALDGWMVTAQSAADSTAFENAVEDIYIAFVLVDQHHGRDIATRLYNYDVNIEPEHLLGAARYIEAGHEPWEALQAVDISTGIDMTLAEALEFEAAGDAFRKGQPIGSLFEKFYNPLNFFLRYNDNLEQYDNNYYWRDEITPDEAVEYMDAIENALAGDRDRMDTYFSRASIRGTRSKAGFAKQLGISTHPVLISGVALIGVSMLLFSTMFASCSTLSTGMGGSIFLASYTADDPDIDNAELIYTEWETDLELEVFSAESRYPGYNEYRFNVGDISHNPFELMAFLTAVYGDFKYADVVSILNEVFQEQYTVTYTPTTETRYADPTDEDGDGDYEPYDWKVLNISLVAKSFTSVAYTRIDDEQREFYNLYMQTKGNRQYLDSPFDFNWLPYMSSYYGYRVLPISGDKNYHKGLDIGVTAGTEIHAGHDGIVTAAAYDSGYGYYIVLDNGKGLVSKYAHCSSLLVSAGQTVQSGDVIALVGNTGNSTGPHLHLEIIMNGQYLNPLYFAETNDDGSGPVYGDPGMPMGESTYGELIRVAEQYLGYPYVWGGSSPATSFDCSGFICWIFKEAGVRDVGRTTAQGLYNLSTPISPEDAQPGDLIFFTRTYSTTDTVTHVGLYVGNGMMLHAGNPIGYVDYVSRYGSLFYSFGRLY